MQTYAKTNSQGAVIEYPLNPVRIKNRGHRLDMYEPVTPTPPPGHNSLTHAVTERMPVRTDDGKLAQTWEVSLKPLTTLRRDMIQALADHRWRIETGGVTLPNGSRILTDRESQAQLTSAYQSLSMPFVESIEWKAADGWVTVTEAELHPIAQAVAQHVQGCFKAERQVSEQIAAAEDAETLHAINIRQAFEDELKSITAA